MAGEAERHLGEHQRRGRGGQQEDEILKERAPRPGPSSGRGGGQRQWLGFVRHSRRLGGRRPTPDRLFFSSCASRSSVRPSTSAAQPRGHERDEGAWVDGGEGGAEPGIGHLRDSAIRHAVPPGTVEDLIPVWRKAGMSTGAPPGWGAVLPAASQWVHLASASRCRCRSVVGSAGEERHVHRAGPPGRCSDELPQARCGFDKGMLWRRSVGGRALDVGLLESAG